MAIDFNKIKERKKIVHITIDESLYKIIEDYKERKNVDSFSPMVNAILWDWIKSNKEELKIKEEETKS